MDFLRITLSPEWFWPMSTGKKMYELRVVTDPCFTTCYKKKDSPETKASKIDDSLPENCTLFFRKFYSGWGNLYFVAKLSSASKIFDSEELRQSLEARTIGLPSSTIDSLVTTQNKFPLMRLDFEKATCFNFMRGHLFWYTVFCFSHYKSLFA